MFSVNGLALLILLLAINDVKTHNYVRLKEYDCDEYEQQQHNQQHQQQQERAQLCQQRQQQQPQQQQKANLKRLTRALIYPPTAPTRLQFIGGIGIPVEDLHFESVTSGYVLKAEYFLPEKAEEYTHVHLKPQIINGRYLYEDSVNGTVNSDYTTKNGTAKVKSFKSQHKNAAMYRWILYRGIEMVLESVGLTGRSCMLRSICEHAALPLSHESGLLAEIVHIILTPSTSEDAYGQQTDRDYLAAERKGRRGGDCTAAYAECKKSPMDYISLIFEESN